MADAYVIEVRGLTVGIVARDGNIYRFYASLRRFHPLEGERFATPRLAEKAASRLMSKQRGYLRDHVDFELAASS